jgi:c-di-GMP-related signal transduction protein
MRIAAGNLPSRVPQLPRPVNPVTPPEEPVTDALLDVFVARQPIFDDSGAIFAYELLYRRSGAHLFADGVSHEIMASEVLVNTFLNIGLEGVTGGVPAFVNFTREMLLDGVWRLFDPALVVVELLETVRPDVEVIAAAEALVGSGYTLALDDFEYDDAYIPLLRLATIVKLDVLSKDDAMLAGMARQLAPYNVRLLAERVETLAVRDVCEGLGYTLFQGYFFSRPETLARRDLSAAQLTILELLNLLRDPDSTDGRVEDAFRGDVSLTYKLLRTVNAASVGGRGIQSILHAIRLVGRGELHKWLSLLLVSSVAGRGGTDAELVHLAIQRARFCELVARQSRDSRSADALFLVGLFSLLDAILHQPLAEILQRIELADEARRALLTRSGPWASTLALAEAWERASWDVASAEAAAIGIDTSQLGEAYVEAVRWARERLQLAA